MADKVYESEVKVSVDASGVEKGAKDAKANLDKIRGSLGAFKDKIGGTAKSLAVMGLGAAGLGIGLGALAHKIIDANLELEEMQDKISGTLYAFRRWRTGIDETMAIDRSIADATKYAAELEQISLKVAVAGGEVSYAFQSLAGPTLQTFGRTEADLIRLTRGAAAAMSVFQRPATETAQILRQLLEKRELSTADPLSVRLRSFLGTAKQIKAMKPEELFNKTAAALEKLTPAAEQLSTGLGGQLFRLRKQLSDNVRSVGGSAFQYLIEQTSKLNTYLKQTTSDGRTIAQVWGDKILSGVKAVGSALGFVKKHWLEITMLVGAWKMGSVTKSAMEFASALEGSLRSARAVGGALGAAGVAGAGMSRGLLGLVTQLGGAVNVAALGLGALAAGAYAFAGWVDRNQTKQLRRNEEVGTFLGQASIHQSKAHYGNAREQTRKMLGALESGGLLTNGKLVPDFAKQIQNLSDDQRRMIGSYLKVGEGSMSPGVHSALIAESFQKRFAERKRWFPDLFDSKKPAAPKPPELPNLADMIKPGKPVVNWNQFGDIKVNQEFKDADPDNVYLRFREDLEAQAANRITSSLMETYAPG